MRATLLAAWCLFAAGCAGGGTYVVLDVDADPAIAGSIARIDLMAALDDKTASATLRNPRGGNLVFPTSTTLDIRSGQGAFSVILVAHDGDGNEVARGSTMTTLVAGRTARLAVQLGESVATGDDMGGVDLTGADLAGADLAGVDGSSPTIPGAPANVVAMSGAASATVTWAAADAGGAAITHYTVTSSPGGVMVTTADGNTLTAALSGLTNGSSYTFTVHATNALGDGPESAPSNAVTPTAVAMVPTAPGNVAAAVKGPSALNVTWSGSDNRGSAITGYTITTSPGGTTATTPDGNTLSSLISGLTPGTAYTFTVTATNGVGVSAASASSAAVTAVDLAGAPTNVAATANLAKGATVTWTAPASNGHGAISKYVVTASPGGATKSTSDGNTTTVAFTGLAANSAYTFTVAAVNVAGNGPASAASNQVLISDIPPAPQGAGACPANAQNRVTWNASQFATSYNLYWSTTAGVTPSTGIKIAGATSPYLHAGLTNGTTYYYVVTAVNSLGESPASSQASGKPAVAVRDAVFTVSYTASAIEAFDCQSTVASNSSVGNTRLITGSNTQIANLYGSNGLYVDGANARIYLMNGAQAGEKSVLVWDDASRINGNVAPSRVIQGASTLINGGYSLTVDVSRNKLYVADYDSATNGISVKIFANAGTANGNVAPQAVIAGATTGAGIRAYGIHVNEATDELYISDYDRDRIAVYGSASTLAGTNNIAPGRVISLSGATTFPFGVALDPSTNMLYWTSRDSQGTVYGLANGSTLNGSYAPTTTLAGSTTQLSAITMLHVLNNTMLAVGDSGSYLYFFANASTSTGNLAPTRYYRGNNTGLISAVWVP